MFDWVLNTPLHPYSGITDIRSLEMFIDSKIYSINLALTDA